MKKSIIVFLLCLTTFRGFAQSVNTYQYDQQNRLKRTTYTNGSETQYTYDALDRRITKQTSGVPVNCIIVVASNPNQAGTISGSGNYLGGSTCSLTATASNGYTFLYWTENGLVVSSDATYSFMVSNDRTLVANFKVTNDTGALNGVFSVSDSTSVVFSQGNLQYQASTGIWRFADNQYDNLGADNYNISPTYEGWIDLFAWGTSGYNHGAVCYMPWSTSGNHEDYYAYGSYECHLNDQTGQADWGYNAISNGGNTTNTWRTLTKDEWDYLLNKRNTVSGIRFTQGRVNGIRGIILLPDNWNNTVFAFEEPNGGNYHINHTQLTLDQWILLEQHGVVFLPYTGILNLSGSNASGFYWSATSAGTHYVDPVIYDNCYGLGFSKGQTQISESNRSSRSAVRLVRSPELYSYEINATSYPMEGGSVVGSGSYQGGSAITLRAIPNEGYFFLNWTENGKVVSTAATDRFYVNGKRTLTANFSQVGGTGVLSGVFSVGENSWVNFSQGNLQYQASSNTWRFATNQYDFMGEDNCNISPTYTGWIDLFGWGTSGYNHGAVCYQPWSTSVADSNYYVYGNEQYELFDQTGMADWGYNAISNGGNTINTWRTPTENEFKYLLFNRDTPSGSRFAMAKVNGVCGLILLPDDWSNSYYPLNNINSDDYSFDSCGNFFSADEWSVLEVHGAVFLPLAGYRIGTAISDELGVYATSNRAEWLNGSSCVMGFGNHYVINGGMHNHYGRSVRLVCPARNKYFHISANADPSEFGTVSFASGTSMYHYGDTATLIANANPGYDFLNWTKNGKHVSANPEYNIVVTGDDSYLANFVEKGSLCYVDIGNGETSSGTLPSDVLYNYSLSQQLYTSEEFGSEGVITSIAFYNDGAENTRNYDFYMKHTQKSTSTNWEEISESDKVFSGEVAMTADEWTFIKLTNPFAYDGISNIVLVANDKTGTKPYPRMKCRVFQGTLQAIRSWTDDNSYNPIAPSIGSYAIGDSKNQLVLIKIPYSGCKRPSHLKTTKVGSDFAKLSWTANNDESEWIIYYKESTDSTYTEVTGVTENPYTLEGLSANTSYQYYVVAKCSAEDESRPSAVFDFKTHCDEATFPLSENFEEFDANTVPECWDNSTSTSTTLNNHPEYLWGVYSYNGNKMLRMNNYYVKNGVALINSPTIELPAEGVSDLKFNYSHTANCGEFTVKISENGGTTFVDLASFSKVGSSTSYFIPDEFYEVNIPLTDYAGKTVLFQFYANANYGNGAIFVDDFEVHFAPTCRVPSGLCANNTTAHSAELSWTANSSESEWTIYYKKSTDATYTEMTGVTQNPYTLDGLSASTNYQYYVVANCSADDESQPSAVFGFKTLCGAVTFPWSENFEEFDANTVPDCWDNSTSTSTTLNNHPDYLWGVYSYNGNKMLRMNNYYVNNGVALINSPMVELPYEGDFELKFNYSHTATCGEFTVKISENGGTTFVDLASFSKVGSSTSYTDPGQFSEANIPLTGYAGKTVMFQFYSDANYGSGAIFVDNIEVRIAPTCRVPSGLCVNTTTAHSAELSWTANSSESEWTIYYKKNTDATYTEVTGVTENPYTLTGLEAASDYIYYLVANCSVDDASEPSAEFSFNTECETFTIDANHSFINGFDFTWPPSCWEATSSNASGSTGSWSKGTTYHSGTASAYSGYYGDIYLIMPDLQLDNNLSSVQFLFWSYYTYLSDYGKSSVVLLEGDNETELWTPDVDSLQNRVWYETNIDLSDYIGQTLRLAFKFEGNNAHGWFIDDIVISAATTTTTQTINLLEGWNWVSTYIESDPINMLEALESALGEHGIQIKSKDKVSAWDEEEEEWDGSLQIFGLTNGNTYMVQTNSNCTVFLEGPPSDPADYEITLFPNTWTWIGFPCAMEVDIEDAFANFIPMAGDQIKSKDTVAAWDEEEEEWSGSMSKLIPGTGYMFFSNSANPRTLIFQTRTKSK